MHTKTMEGLVGAKTNIDMMNTPIRVYKEARRKGDTATMERAMGYAADFAERANEYKEVADDGMKKDAEEAREKAKLEREKAIEKRKEEREKLENKIEESKCVKEDIVEISDAGKDLCDKDNANNDIVDFAGATELNHEISTYSKDGKVNQTESCMNISISV